MGIEQPLFESERICLGPIDMEKDPQVEAGWTNDAYYLRMLSVAPARPMSAAQVKKKYEEIEKAPEELQRQYYFAVRMRRDDRLVGFGRIFRIGWNTGAALIELGIGAASDRNCGFGKEILRLLLRFAFDELNLYRLTAQIPEYNLAAQRLFAGADFVEEVRRREALYRDGRRWDMLHNGLLRDEWQP